MLVYTAAMNDLTGLSQTMRHVLAWQLIVAGVTFGPLSWAAPAGAGASEVAAGGERSPATVGDQAAAGQAAVGEPAVGDPAGQEAQTALWEAGPKTVALGNEVTVELPSGYVYLPPEPAKKLLEANGSFHNEGVLGLFASDDPKQEDWFVIARFDDSGFVKDDEELDAEEILSSLKEGVEEMNEERKERGFTALALDGWAEPPRYDKGQHHLVWALIVSDPEGKSVNLNTRVLGRRGYVSLNLVTDPNTLAGYRHHATALLSATKFDAGARYEDFNESSDKVAEYGLAGLVMAGAGLGAAKLVKLGLLAKFSKVIIAALLAGKKFIVLGAVALFALVKKLLGGSKSEAPPTNPA